MKKKTNSFPFEGRLNCSWFNNLSMKLTIIIIFLSLFQTAASPTIAQEKVTLDVNEASLKSVLTLIKKETGYKFLFRNSEIDLTQKVTITAKNESLSKVMDKILFNRGINYSIIEKQMSAKSKG